MLERKERKPQQQKLMRVNYRTMLDSSTFLATDTAASSFSATSLKLSVSFTALL